MHSIISVQPQKHNSTQHVCIHNSHEPVIESTHSTLEDQHVVVQTAMPTTQTSAGQTGNDPQTGNVSHPSISTTSNHHTQQNIIVTRSKNNIFKPKTVFAATKHDLKENLEPSTINQTLKIPQWREASFAEFDALLNNGTWTLVPKPENTNLVGCKWLFIIKRNPDGSVARYKARLVAKGFTQTPGLDFKETFAPVVKPRTIKVVLTLALNHGWSLHQMDVNNAFLQGNLTEDVYMQQPPGFVHTEYPTHVCKLRKAIYGLRQAPRTWHDSLKAFVVSYGFSTSLSDSSLFIYNRAGVQAFLLVYVDDLLLTGSNVIFLNQFMKELSNKFSLKLLGFPHYFLGIELIPTKEGLLLSQHGYIRELLNKFHMSGAKSTATPLCTTSPLKLNDGSAPADSKMFRSLLINGRSVFKWV